MAVPVLFEGVVYPSTRIFAEALGLDIDTFRTVQKTRPHFTLEEIVEECRKRADKESFYGAQGVTIWGNAYPSVVAACDAYGVTLSSLYGIGEKDIEQAMSKALSRTITFKGKQYPSLTSLCVVYGIPAANVYTRLSSGWSLDRALTTPLKKSGKNHGFSFRGKKYATVAECLRFWGIERSFLLNFKRISGCSTPADALEALLAFLSRYDGDRPASLSAIPYVVYNGVWHQNEKSFLQACGITGSPKGLKGANPFSWMEWVQSLEHMEYLYEGESYMWGALAKKISLYVLRRLVSTGEIVAHSVKNYPTCSYNPTGYCANIRQDYLAYIQSLREANNA